MAAVGTCALTLVASELARSQGVDIPVAEPFNRCKGNGDPFEEVTVVRAIGATNPGAFRIDLEDDGVFGLSVFEVDKLPPEFQSAKIKLPFRIKYRKPKLPLTPGTVVAPPMLSGGLAMYTPPPPGHWSLRFPGFEKEAIKKLLSEYAKDFVK